jgi:hypothetical protein
MQYLLETSLDQSQVCVSPHPLLMLQDTVLHSASCSFIQQMWDAGAARESKEEGPVWLVPWTSQSCVIT